MPYTSVSFKCRLQVVILGLGCITTISCNRYKPLTKEGHGVVIVKKEPIYCHDLGTFKGRGGSVKGSINIVRNKIADKGGDSLYLTRHEEIRAGMIFKRLHGNIVYGRGFKCKR